MAVHKRAYSAYSGPSTEPALRFLVLTRDGWSSLFLSRSFTAFYVMAALVPLLIGALLIYVANAPTVRAMLHAGNGLFIERLFFLEWLKVQGSLGLLLAAWVGPSLVSPDLTNGALPLYLSRPLSRRDYVVGKSLVLSGLLSLLSWIPALLLFGLQASLGPAGWAAENLLLIPAIVASSLLWIAFLCALSLAVSAWVRWRIVATGLTFAIFFFPAGFGEVVNVVLRTSWGHLFNFWYLIALVWQRLFGVTDSVSSVGPWIPNVPLWAAVSTLCAAIAGCLLLLNQRLRAKEVVSG